MLAKIEELLASSEASKDNFKSDGPLWIFGTDEPTALDAHVVPFLARLLDVGRQAMFEGKDRVLTYAEGAFQTEAWKQVMQGRKTVYGTYL